MSTSPSQPDPYLALGISKDADIDTIKKAHRKLVLKHHPDRIQNPALIEAGKNEFQKVQQAYELLSDPARRNRYDDECRLAELRRDRMMSEREYARTSSSYTVPRHGYPTPSTPRSAYPQPPPPTPREMRPEPQPRYEERVPESYFDPSPRFDGYTSRMPEEPPLSRHTARKDPHSFEKQRPSATRPSLDKKDKPRSSAWERAFQGVSRASAFSQTSKASSSKKKAETQAAHARDAKSRDKAQRNDRMDKNSRTSAPYASSYVQDGSSESDTESDSDSDTVVYSNQRSGQAGRSTQAQPQARPRSPDSAFRSMNNERGFRTSDHSRDQPSQRRQLTPEPPRRRPAPSTRQYSQSDNDLDASGDEWEKHHYRATDYIQQSKQPSSRSAPRPNLPRQSSEHQYWHGCEVGGDHRRSGSDSDRQRQQASTKPLPRSVPVEQRRPPIPKQSSAPIPLRGMVPEAARSMASEVPPSTFRARHGSYDARVPGGLGSHRKGLFPDDDQPSLKRQNSEPVSSRGPVRQNTMPRQSSTLKQSEVPNDSGYGSSSPQTPEMRGFSPPPTSRSATTSTKYKAKKSDDDSHHRARRVSQDRRGRDRRQSPEPRARKSSIDSRVQTESRGRQPSLERSTPRRASPAMSNVSRMTADGGPIRQHLSPEDAPTLGRSEERRERKSSRSREREAPRTTSGRPAKRPSVSRNESSRREELPRRGRATTDQSGYKLPPNSMAPAQYTTRQQPVFSSTQYAPKPGLSRQASVHRVPQPSRKTSAPVY